MVLGIVTGSVPMLMSLLFMQGITLTMWRSFLDKAIPQYNGEQWRKNLGSLVQGPGATTTMSPLENPIQLVPTMLQQSSAPQPTQLPTTSAPSTFDHPQIDPVTNSLQILANMDPKLIELLSQLQSGEPKPQDKTSTDNNHATSQSNQQLSTLQQQLNTLTALQQLAKLLQSIQTNPTTNVPSGIGIGEMYDPTKIQQQPYMQYAQVEPNYFEVSSGQQPNQQQNEDQETIKQTEPEEAEEDLDNNKYELVEENNSKKKETQTSKTKINPNSLYEEVDYDDDSEPDDDYEEVDYESDEDEEQDPHRKMTIREKIRSGKIFAASKTKMRFLKQKPPKRKKETRMFGKPRVKRMSLLDSSPFQYAQTQLKKKLNYFLSFPLLKRNANENKVQRKPKQHKQQSWKRTTNPSNNNKANYRFATPKVPIIVQPTKANNSDLNSSETDIARKYKKKKVPSKKNLKLKSNKITVTDSFDGLPDNCTTIDDSQTKSKKQFKEIWSQKNGWSKCHTKSPSFRITKGIIIPNIEANNFDLSTTTLKPEINDETTSSLPLTTDSSSQESITDEPETSSEILANTTLPATTTFISIPDSVLIDFNNFLNTFSLSTSTTTPFETSSSTTTSTTTMAPSITTARNFMDELPKEFLIHILNVINSSKIDSYQLNEMNTVNNHKLPNNNVGDKNAIQDSFDQQFESFLKSSNNFGGKDNKPWKQEDNNNGIGDTTEEDYDEDFDTDDFNNEEWNHQDDNRVDGKILVAHRFKRVCYYLLNGGRDAQLDINQLELHICSHLIVGYARISTNGMVVAQKPLEDTEKYRRSTLMKLQYPKLKVLLSVGDLGGTMFSIVASNDRTRERFIMSVLDICHEFNFDGVDIDWEFPGLRTPGSVRDKQNLVLLLKELRQKSNQFWKNKSKIRGPFLISLAVGAPLIIASTSYLIPDIGRVVDFVNLMSYDFHYYRPDKPYTGHHAPLYPRSTDNAYFSTLNVAWTATYWANSGMPLKKIIVGVPTYARTYNLVVPIGQNMINVPANGPGLGKGKLNYTQVCEFLKLPGTMKQFDFHSQVPYAYRGFDWIAYENEMSVSIKAQWVIKTGMGGIVTFALNFDDATGTCRDDGKRFPLQKTISNLLELASVKSYKKSLYVAKIRSG